MAAASCAAIPPRRGGIPTASRYSSTTRAVAKGAIAALIAVAALVAIAFAVFGGDADRASASHSGTVVVFVGPAADGAQVADAIAVESADGAFQRAVDPETTCTVVGTSYHTLQDAYPFIGARGIAEKVVGENAGWVDVPLSAWKGLLGTKGVTLTLQSTMDVFDGAQLYTFKAGKTAVTGETLSAFLKGTTFLGEAERKSVCDQLAQLSLERLNAAEKPAGVTSNLGD